MSIINLPVITETDPDKIREVFEKTYLGREWFFEGIKVVVFPEDFEHVCFEYASKGVYKGKFSLRRARRLLAIRELCEGKIPYILIHQINRPDQSICVLAESIELAMYLVPQPSDKGVFFRLGTIIVFGKDVEKRMEKQKQAGKVIQNVTEVVSFEANNF